MASFPGGSAWAMARDLAAGYLLMTERTLRPFKRPELEKIQFEMERLMREVRGDQPALDDLKAIQLRNRKLQRLRTAKMVMQTYRRKMKI